MSSNDTEIIRSIESYFKQKISDHSLLVKQEANSLDEIKTTDGTTALMIASECDDIMIVDHYIRFAPHLISKQNKEGNTALHFAAKNNMGCVVRTLLMYGSEHADICNIQNQQGDTPLHVACSNNHTLVAKMLINASPGANINIENNFGEVPLCNAIKYNNAEITELLIKKGSTLNIGFHSGGNILHQLVRIPNIDINLIAYLVTETRININNQDKWGNTVLNSLLRSEKCCNTQIITKLIHLGADLTIPNKAGHLPINIAERHNKQFVELIRQNSGRDWQ